MEETFGADGTLQRETKGEVVLTPRLHAAQLGAAARGAQHSLSRDRAQRAP
jgi:hypothetical protein